MLIRIPWRLVVVMLACTGAACGEGKNRYGQNVEVDGDGAPGTGRCS